MKPLLERYLFRKCKRKWTKLLKWLKKMNEEPHPVLHGLHDRTGHIAVAYGSKVWSLSVILNKALVVNVHFACRSWSGEDISGLKM